MKTEKILYYDSSGEENTETTIGAALERARQLGIKDIVVASVTGATGLRACEAFKSFNVVVVSGQVGIPKPGVSRLLKANEEKIRSLDGKIFMGTHSLSGVERAIRAKWNTIEPVEIIADALKIFGNGVKACAEITLMAADAGLIPIDKDVIAIAGSHSGADTALVIGPAHASNFFDMTIREVICKPRTRE